MASTDLLSKEIVLKGDSEWSVEGGQLSQSGGKARWARNLQTQER